MKSTYNITNTQKNLPKLVRDLKKRGGIVPITVHDETAAYLVSTDRMEAIAETFSLMSNPELMQAIRHHKTGTMKFVDLNDFDEND